MSYIYFVFLSAVFTIAVCEFPLCNHIIRGKVDYAPIVVNVTLELQPLQDEASFQLLPKDATGMVITGLTLQVCSTYTEPTTVDVGVSNNALFVKRYREGLWGPWIALQGLVYIYLSPTDQVEVVDGVIEVEIPELSI